MAITLNDFGIISGNMTLPLSNIWSADFVIDQTGDNQFTPGTSVTLKVQDKDFTLKGTVVPDRTGSLTEAIHVRVVGGKNGMTNIATPKQFKNGRVSDVLNSLMNDSKESLSNKIDQGLLNTQLPFWTITGVEVSSNLNMLLEIVAPTAHWRFVSDGSLWIGIESWNSVSGNYEIVDGTNPKENLYVLGVSTPFLYPGDSIDNYKVSMVVHKITSDSVRSFVYTPSTNGEERGILPAINDLIDASLSKLDFYAVYPAKVISQSADYKSVDVQVNNKLIPGMQGIPYLTGLGGSTTQIINGQVLIGWTNGDPSQPYALSLSGESIAKTVITTSSGNTLTLSNSGFQFAFNGINVIDASIGSLKLGLVGNIPFLYNGSTDSLGVPISPNPVTLPSIIKGG